MSNNDSINRGEVLALLNATSQEEMTNECFDRLYNAVAHMDAVPQEMSAREFVATISDMCINQFPEGCAPCPLWVAGHGCGEKILPPEDTVAIVEAWAREHPEERSEQ